MPTIENTIKSKLEKDLKKKLGVTALPTDVKKIVDSASKQAGSVVTKQNINKHALRYGKEVFRETNHKKMIGERISSALKGVEVVTQSSDLQKILDENAKMLFSKMRALKSAGFTDDQSFQLIIAEVSAKKAK